MLNALTIDVEDYFQVSAFEPYVSRLQWDAYESRVVPNTRRLLRLFRRHGARATFFILGWVADRFPDLVREIDEAGHEIGSHSYWHRLIYRLTPEVFAADLRQSIAALENVVSRPVRCFRAPSFSITRQSRWALDLLAEQGIEIDSSIMPVVHHRYGMPRAPRGLHRLGAERRTLWEFPPAVARYVGMNLPVGGGGYFRLLPLTWTVTALRSINRSGEPFVFYLHPWEIDPEQPRISGPSRRALWRHTVNLDTTEAKLAALLDRFEFAPLGEVIQHRRHQSTTADTFLKPGRPELLSSHPAASCAEEVR